MGALSEEDDRRRAMPCSTSAAPRPIGASSAFGRCLWRIVRWFSAALLLVPRPPGQSVIGALCGLGFMGCTDPPPPRAQVQALKAEFGMDDRQLLQYVAQAQRHARHYRWVEGGMLYSFCRYYQNDLKQVLGQGLWHGGRGRGAACRHGCGTSNREAGTGVGAGRRSRDGVGPGTSADTLAIHARSLKGLCVA